LVVLVFYLYRTCLFTFSTASAFFYVYVPRVLKKSYFEIPRLSINADKLCIGYEFYVQVPADLDQLRRNNSHGTVIGGKGLV